MYKLKKFISLVLIFTLIWIRVFAVLPVAWADDPPVPPTAPSAPSAPSAPVAPTAPSAPSAPSAPAAPPPPGESAPTSPPVPTYNVPTAGTSPLPTSNTLPTGSTSSQTDYGTTNDSSNATGNSSDPSNSSTEEATSSDYVTDPNVNDPANLYTGPSSMNQAQEIMEKNMEVLNKNKADLQNKVDAITSSGFNYANFNTMNGQVSSGDSVATLNLLNKLNSNVSGTGDFQVFNLYGNQAGNIVFQFANDKTVDNFTTASSNVSKNAVTGPGSINLSDASNSFTVKEANGNDANIVNDIVLQSSTGNNSATGNTGDGAIETGNATAVGNIINLANTNLNVTEWLFGVVNIFGTLAGNILLPENSSSNSTGNTTAPSTLVANNATGPGSTNVSEYENTDVATFENVNDADITSNLDVSANTGNNTSSYNTGGGNVKTGNTDASISNNTISNVNTTKEDDTVWMIIVNEMGQWVGHIIGSPWGSTTASNALPISSDTGGVGSQSYSTQVTNSGTGPFSYNESSQNNTSNTTVTNDNTVRIENNVTAAAETGNNSATYNTGKGSIETGDAKVGVNLVNMANTNVTARKFVAILVNVIGSFLGDIIPGEQQSTQLSGNIASPTPTTYQSNNTGGTENIVVTPTPTVYQQEETASTAQDTFDYQKYYEELYRQWYEEQIAAWNRANQAPPVVYTEAVNTVATYKTYTRNYRKQLVQQNTAVKNEVVQIFKTQRGLYLSPAFAKATESSLPGILLGGVSLRISDSWLWVVPVTIFLVLLRRRKRFQITKYVNYLLEVIL